MATDKNNLIVYCEYEDGKIADVSLELLTKGRTLADKLGIKLEAVVAGDNLKDIEKQVFPYGVDRVYKVEDKRLYPYTSLPHSSILINLFKEIEPRIAFMGATAIGRDLGPRVSSALHSGLTADCTALEIGDQVVTIGGIVGRVVAIKDDTFVLETGSDRVKIRFTKNAISSVEKLNMDNAPANAKK